MTPYGRRHLEHIAEREALELRQVVGHHQTLAGRRPAVHVVGIAGDRLASRGLRHARDVDRHHHHGRLPENDARVPHRLHALHAGHRRQLAFHRPRESESCEPRCSGTARRTGPG